MQNIRIEKTTAPRQKPDYSKPLEFGAHFTDHMFIMNYEDDKGWHDPRIVPYAPLSLMPAASCFHYAQEAFEGLKAYETSAGKFQLFRADENFKRLNKSCERICIPALDEEMCVNAVKALVELDKDWMPSAAGCSLYIRPFIIATDLRLGVHPAHNYLFIIIMSPVGSYYPEGINPVKIYVESNYVRAATGGTGMSKVGGNYAASLLAQKEAAQKGYSQVLWLDSIHRKYIDEVGAMNVFFVLGDEVVTPSLNGTILPGITRMSAIELLRSFGLKVSERQISIDEIAKASENGELKEMFGTGTAAVVSPVGMLRYKDIDIVINNNETGPLTKRLYDKLTGIQYGNIPDEFGWILPV